MVLRNFPVIPSVADSLLSDRFSRIDRLFSQLTGDTPVPMTPPYDLKQLDNERYALTVSVLAGRRKSWRLRSQMAVSPSAATVKTAPMVKRRLLEVDTGCTGASAGQISA